MVEVRGEREIERERDIWVYIIGKLKTFVCFLKIISSSKQCTDRSKYNATRDSYL